ncbi:MAG TPA: thiamine phosphate synthase [Polyangiaceae bacterium LLY-WYZ-15_(1-7)]|nr:thiamine phosphate synthase [Polyangiaceae bacterium LLY-WYZ-15_(1-7)]
MPVSWRGFYAIVDPAFCRRSPLETADAILAGRCCAVLQLRDKRGDDRETLALARALKSRAAAASVPFVMNDRLDLALLAEADGLHLGQDDLPIAEARRLFDGPIGVSTHDLDQLRAAAEAGADLAGFGPVFATSTKENPDPVVGLEGLRAAAASVDLPLVAIGGVTPERAADLRDAGAALLAAISAVCGAADPDAVAARLHPPLSEAS